MWVVITVVAVIVLIATYVTWSASRVDRLHARASAAFSALDAQSVRRAAVAAEAGGEDVQAAARTVLTAHPDDRETAENDLTRTLRTWLDKAEPDKTAIEALSDTSRRLALARQVYTDLARDALAVRRHPLVRLLGLTRRHPVPRFFDIDDPTLDEPA
jgi:erythromycin esterase-like protein